MRDELKRFLKLVRETTGTFVFSTDGLRWYEEWYQENRDTSDFEDLRLNGYYERRPDHLLRVAMLLAISEQLPLVLTADVLERAFAILQAIEPQMPIALKSINLSAAGRESQRLLAIITAAKDQLPYAQLMSAAMKFMNARMIDETLKGLIAAGKVTEFITPRGRVYRLRDNGIPDQGD